MGLDRKVGLLTGLRYKGQRPYLTYILHRIGGGALFIFLTMYILLLAGVDSVNAIFSHWAFQIVLLVFGLFHAINGLRITLMDLRPRWIEHFRAAMTIEWLAYAVLAGFAVFTILQNAFGS